jgi:hypothetical protein
MVRICPKCGTENPEGTFWCGNCDNILLKEQAIDQRNVIQESRKEILVQQGTFKSFDTYENKAIKYFIIGFVIIIILVGILIYLSVFGSNFNWITCQFNEDFWFEEDQIITSDGWTFTMDRVQDYTLEGRVLALKTYNKYDSPYDPCNYFCPIDLFIGIEDVKTNPEKYDYSIRSFNNRVVYWYMTYDNVADYNYFKTHVGNNHLIPHSEDVLKMMQNISVNDKVKITGGLVNLYGERGSETLYRPTDTHIGNYACEAILVDNIVINSK